MNKVPDSRLHSEKYGLPAFLRPMRGGIPVEADPLDPKTSARA